MRADERRMSEDWDEIKWQWLLMSQWLDVAMTWTGHRSRCYFKLYLLFFLTLCRKAWIFLHESGPSFFLALVFLLHKSSLEPQILKNFMQDFASPWMVRSLQTQGSSVFYESSLWFSFLVLSEAAWAVGGKTSQQSLFCVHSPFL